jgi:hypothetical protein
MLGDTEFPDVADDSRSDHRSCRRWCSQQDVDEALYGAAFTGDEQ